MSKESEYKCKVCGANIDINLPHYVLSFKKEALEGGEKKVLESVEGPIICLDCGQEGMESVLRELKLTFDSDTELKEKMEKIRQSADIIALMKDYDISGERIGVSNLYLARCPFHDQEASFLIDGDRKEYFCLCEGLSGDIFSFVINYNRDIKQTHTTLKQAVDTLIEKYHLQ
ncbi:MAG: CHC2 zinc finger domain-containing protein [Candidatus Aminicenantales bacterium]